MSRTSLTSVGLLLTALLSGPTIAQSALPDTSAENVRNLNIMFMVTSLRCRNGAHDFSAEYDRFALTHGRNIADAQRRLVSRLTAQHGRRGSERHLDRQSVQVANRYGLGHPTLDCAQLKEAAIQLSASGDRVKLDTMAAELLNPAEPRSDVALADVSSNSAIPYDNSVSLSEAPAWLRE